MNNFELIPGLVINLSFVVGIMVKISMFLLLILSLVMVRQESLMNRVVSFPIGGSLKTVTWAFFVVMMILTFIVLLA